MNRINTILIIILSVFCFGQLSAQKTYAVKDIPNTRLQGAQNHVSDPERILSATTVQQVNSILQTLEEHTSIEVAVVVVPSIGNYAIEDYAVDLFRTWGIGQKGRDNGLLMLLATSDRTVRMEVGYGLEGDLPDAIAKRIQTTRMLPYLRSSDWDNAVIAGVEGIYEYLNDPNSDLNNAYAGSPDPKENIISRILFIFFGLLLIVIFAWVSQRRARRCPRCGATMRVSNSYTTKISPTVNRVTTVLLCPKCGNTITKSHNQHIQSGGGIGPVIGGGFGGRGGGFGGGSWGGGRSGGGGATTRF